MSEPTPNASDPGSASPVVTGNKRRRELDEDSAPSPSSQPSDADDGNFQGDVEEEDEEDVNMSYEVKSASQDEEVSQIPKRQRIRGRDIDDDSDDDDRRHGDGDDSADEGEDINEGEKYERDYREIPALDKYENRMLDNREYDDIAADAKRAAEADMRRREKREMAQSGRRLPAALQDSDDDMSDFEPQVMARRRMAERAAGEDGMDYDEDDVDFALEDFGDVPLSEWLAQDRPRAEIKKQFKTFLRTYGSSGGTPLYSERIQAMCAANEQSLMVNYEHLSDAYPNLAVWLADAPRAMITIFDEVATVVVLSEFDAYGDIHDEIYVRISDLPIKDKLRDLRQCNLHQLVRVEGVVTRRTSVFPQLKQVRYRCLGCSYLLDPFQVENVNGSKLPQPTSCPQCQGANFHLDFDHTLYRNYQKITLQESPGKVPAGRVPRRKDVIVGNDLIDAARPGEEVLITGIYENTYDVRLAGTNGFPVFSTVISANYIEKLDATSTGEISEDDMNEIRKMSRNERIGELIVESMAPSIYGCEDVKRAVALSMFGGQEKDINGKHHVRGDINCLLLGDPGEYFFSCCLCGCLLLLYVFD